jgi:predicted outer membrane lipoprotein
MDSEIHIDTEHARGGSTPHIVRWVLGISLAAAIVILSAVWMTGALRHDSANKAVTAAHEAAAGKAF